MNLTSNDGIVAENNTMADNTNSSVNQTIEDIETDDIVDTLSDTDTSTQPISIGSVSEEGLSFSKERPSLALSPKENNQRYGQNEDDLAVLHRTG